MHKTRSRVHKSAFWVSATAAAACAHESSLDWRLNSTSTAAGSGGSGESGEASPRSHILGRYGLHPFDNSTHSSRNSHISLYSISPSHFITKLTPLPPLHLTPISRSQLPNPPVTRSETKRTCFCGPHHSPPQQNLPIMRNNWP